jgi:hypothetical protein
MRSNTGAIRSSANEEFLFAASAERPGKTRRVLSHASPRAAWRPFKVSSSALLKCAASRQEGSSAPTKVFAPGSRLLSVAVAFPLLATWARRLHCREASPLSSCGFLLDSWPPSVTPALFQSPLLPFPWAESLCSDPRFRPTNRTSGGARKQPNPSFQRTRRARRSSKAAASGAPRRSRSAPRGAPGPLNSISLGCIRRVRGWTHCVLRSGIPFRPENPGITILLS